MALKLSVEIARLVAELEHLASISDSDPNLAAGGSHARAVTRVVFSETDRKAREFVKSLFHQADLTIREDAVGNTFARWEGSDPTLLPVATGSHIDAIPNAGAYDGTVGVLGAIEAIRTLKKAGFTPRRSLELILFTAEEPTRFGIGCLGSRLLSGALSAKTAADLRDPDGQTLEDLRRKAGFSGSLETVRLLPNSYHAFLELHIEQGPLLEAESLRSGRTTIGVVTSIAAPASLRITIEGEGGHAGAVLMPHRHDALCAASEIILALESTARSTGAADSVATVGVCEVFPGAVNSVPSRVRLLTDIRDTDAERRDGMEASLRRVVAQVAERRGVQIQIELLNSDPPATCDPRLIQTISQAASQLRIASLPIVSRAYHDTLFFSRICPAAMIFIPCRNGISHRPDEFADPEWIKAGVEVLAASLAELCG